MPDTGLNLTATVLVACFLFVWEVMALFVFGADPSPTTVYDFAMLFGIPVGFMISATAKEAPAVAGALALGGLAVVIACSAGVHVFPAITYAVVFFGGMPLFYGVVRALLILPKLILGFGYLVRLDLKRGRSPAPKQ